MKSFKEYLNEKRIINYPKRKDKETIEQYAERLGVSVEELKIDHDFYTHETNYKGYGWDSKD